MFFQAVPSPLKKINTLQSNGLHCLKFYHVFSVFTTKITFTSSRPTPLASHTRSCFSAFHKWCWLIFWKLISTPVAWFCLSPTASDNRHRKPDSSASLWMTTESSVLQDNKWFPAIFYFPVWMAYRHLSLRKKNSQVRFLQSSPVCQRLETFWCLQSPKAVLQLWYRWHRKWCLEYTQILEESL